MIGEDDRRRYPEAMRRALIIQYVFGPVLTEEGPAVRGFAGPILRDRRTLGTA